MAKKSKKSESVYPEYEERDLSAFENDVVLWLRDSPNPQGVIKHMSELETDKTFSILLRCWADKKRMNESMRIYNLEQALKHERKYIALGEENDESQLYALKKAVSAVLFYKYHTI